MTLFSWQGSMNMKKLLFVVALFVLFSSQLLFGQAVCVYGGGTTAYAPNGCAIAATTGAGENTISVYVNPGYSGALRGYEVSGTLSGVGQVLGNSQLSFPCQGPTENEEVLWANTVLSPGVYVATATITACGSYPHTPWVASLTIRVTPSPPPSPPTPCSVSSVSLIDPVASGLLSGNAVTQDTSRIAAASSTVSGAAADGVTQVIVEVPTGQAGGTVQLTLLNENGQQDSVANDGGLFPLGGDPGSASSTLPAPVQGTSSPTAYAVWLAPSNYYRGTQDAATVERSLKLQAQCTNSAGSPATVSQTISTTRPPVVLVHGIWSSPSETWGYFSPTIQNNLDMWNLLFQESADYSGAVYGVTATSPSYQSPPPVYYQNALGFSYNALTVLQKVQKTVGDFEKVYNVAAVQADVVAHSMGGDIARVMPSVTVLFGVGFVDQSNYGLGPVHKLITIGTPHQGSPLAGDLLPYGSGDPNSCFRNTLEEEHMPSFQTVWIGGNPVDGAVGDLAAAPANLPPSEPFPMAYLAGSTNAASLQNLDSTLSRSEFLRIGCWTLAINGSPLAYDLTPTLWNSVFTGQANDGVVPVSSQLNTTGSTGANTFQGVIHSPGIETLNFAPPSEVDPQSGIPDAVVNLLNEATNGPDFDR
jgi:hypothetical protein